MDDNNATDCHPSDDRSGRVAGVGPIFLTGVLAMTDISAGNVEMAIVLPLGVVGKQLMRIESDLRSLNMKVLHAAKERDDGRHTELITATLEGINVSLDSIRQLVAEFGADIHPKSSAASRQRYHKHDTNRED
jgi:hypothetical protein